MHVVDLNCDMGESFGAWKMGNDAALMDYVSSVNIACGFHAGDPSTIRATIDTAIEKGVAIGAHPSYPDLQGFGRRQMSLSFQEIYDLVLYQVAALKGICEAGGGKLHHVKPHGALYNQAAKNKDMSRAIAEAVKAVDQTLILYGGSKSELITEAKSVGLRAASEVFADRTYQSDGSLTPRNQTRALIADSQAAIDQAVQMVEKGTVISLAGDEISIEAETICLHGDGEQALEFAVAIRRVFDERNIEVRPI